MFFKKYDVLTEREILGIGITSATIAYAVESKYPSSNPEAWINGVNKSVDTALSNIKLNLDKKTLENIRLVAFTLASNPDGFISNRVTRFSSGNKDVTNQEFLQALNIIQKSVKDFTRDMK